MNPKKIEMNSINKLKDDLEHCERISSDIPDNDRSPSWDGNVYLYSTSSLEKKDMQGVVRVQVKGKKVNNIKKEEISYSVDLADIRNYRNAAVLSFL